jgi:hypothetical protein
MAKWQGDFQRGIRMLARHDPGGALLFFSRSLKACPAKHCDELTHVLYYMGIALKRLGYSNSAVRSWITSLRMRRHKETRALLGRFCNCYGMAKQECGDQDDWQAFYSIQLMRYLRGFQKRTLSSRTERIVLRDIIGLYWRKLKGTGALAGKSPEQKCELFKSTHIDFPLFFEDQAEEPVLLVDFGTGRKVGLGDKCPCGSGLPYIACCGRTPGEDELAIGLF